MDRLGAPTGTVAFLFTDVEGSTALWEARPDAMAKALARHDDILRSAIAQHRGVVFSTAGDAFSAAFWTPTDAVSAASDAQATLTANAWGEDSTLRVRMGVHVGVADERNGDYFGQRLPLHRLDPSAGRAVDEHLARQRSK